MWTFFAPTKAKIGASLIIVGAMWASESLALHLWTFLNADLFAEMGKRFAEQDPQQIGKMVQDMFSRGWFGGRRIMLLPIFQWISRSAFAYLAACIVVNAVSTPSRPQEPVPENERASQLQPPLGAGG